LPNDICRYEEVEKYLSFDRDTAAIFAHGLPVSNAALYSLNLALKDFMACEFSAILFFPLNPKFVS